MKEAMKTIDNVLQGTEQYEALISAIPGGIIIAAADDNLTILFANEDYYRMVGYERDAHEQEFHKSAIATLHPQEAQETLRCAHTQLAETGAFSVSVRMRHRTKGYMGMRLNGKQQPGPNGEARLCISLTDISEYLTKLETLESENSINELISTLSEECFFDCDLQYGTMRYSKNFMDKVGIYDISSDYLKAFRQLGLLTEEYTFRPAQDFWASLANNPERELQFIQPNGESLWYLCRCTLLHDSEETPIRIVGKLIDITRHKMQIDELFHLTQRDQLTGLYNKASTERQIKEMLKRRRVHDDNYAWMIIDIDNFKNVNDRLGHLYGDVVLTQLAEQLKSLFRADDLVGRAGGDEFFVFLKSYGSIDILQKKAEEICGLFHKTYSEGDTFVTISASIGIALCPQHGTDFDVLYKRADAALYQVKASGKNAVSFYTSKLTHDYTSGRTEIDVNTLTKSFKDNRIEYVFRLLYDSGNPASSIQAVLQLVTESYGFSRGYIFETSPDGTSTSNTFEWCAKGITAEIQNLQNVPIEAVSTANSRFLETGMFILKSIHELPDIERNVLEPQGIRSMFQFGIMDMGKLVGFIGFDDCISERIPTDVEIDEICTVCHVLATFLLKHRGNERQIRHHKAVEMIMDQMNCYAYVIDRETRSILYENQPLARLVGKSSCGQKCFTAYRGFNTPCTDCPMEQMGDGEGRYYTEIQPDRSDRCVRLEASRIRWSDNQSAILLWGADIPEHQCRADKNHLQEGCKRDGR